MGSRNKGKTPTELSTEELIFKVCTEFTEKIESSMEKKFTIFQEKLNELNNSFTCLSKTVSANEMSISLLNKKVDSLEQTIKNNTLRINGLAEVQEFESVTKQVIQFFTTKLGVTCQAEDFSSIVRIGRYDGTNDKPRAIIVNFLQKSKRSEIFRAKKKTKK